MKGLCCKTCANASKVVSTKWSSSSSSKEHKEGKMSKFMKVLNCSQLARAMAFEKHHPASIRTVGLSSFNKSKIWGIIPASINDWMCFSSITITFDIAWHASFRTSSREWLSRGNNAASAPLSITVRTVSESPVNKPAIVRTASTKLYISFVPRNITRRRHTFPLAIAASKPPFESDKYANNPKAFRTVSWSELSINWAATGITLCIYAPQTQTMHRLKIVQPTRLFLSGIKFRQDISQFFGEIACQIGHEYYWKNCASSGLPTKDTFVLQYFQ